MTRIGSVAAVLGLAALAGCEAPASEGVAPPLGDYQLLRMGDEDVEGFHVTLMLSEDAISGRGFCNRYNGAQEGELPAFAVGTLAVTRRACPDDRMARDQALFDALSGADQASFADDRLTVTGTGPTLIFEPHQSEPERPAE